MPLLTTDQLEATAKRRVRRRIFAWFDARNPDTGDPDPAGFHDDAGTVDIDGRSYKGVGAGLQLSQIEGVADLGIPGTTVVLSGVDPAAVALINSRSIGQAPVEVLFGVYDVDTHELIPPLVRMFKGVVDEPLIRTPARGGRASIEVALESIARALTVKRTVTRSPDSHKERVPADEFYDYTPGLRERTIYFGRRDPNASKAGPRGNRR